MLSGVITGQILTVGSSTGIRVRDAEVVDTDGIRGNSTDESISFNLYGDVFTTGFTSQNTREVETRVTFRDGSSASGIEALAVVLGPAPYSGGGARYALNSDKLAALGKTLSDVTDVRIVRDVNHNLSYEQLGFAAGGVNRAPVALSDTYVVNQGGTFDVTAANGLLRNDSDPDGTPLKVVGVSAERGLNISVNEDGSFTATTSSSFGPNARFATFTYDVSDGVNVVTTNGLLYFVANSGPANGNFILPRGVAPAPTPEPTPAPTPTPTPQPEPTPTPAPEPEPTPTPEPELNFINGNSRGNRLNGTNDADAINGGGGNDRIYGRDGDDIIRGGADDDRMYGGNGADAFVFGDSDRDRDRDYDRIYDFDDSEDVIVLEDGASIRRTLERNDDLYIQLNGDRDWIIVYDQDRSILDDIIYEDGTYDLG